LRRTEIPEPTVVLLGFGSNLGERRERIEAALSMLLAEGALTMPECSALYETEPVGYTDQPAFLNAVVKGLSTLSARDLLVRCKLVEKKLGRIGRQAWHEREIDIDVLFFGVERISLDSIRIPHPRLHERRFVLVPAAEIAPDFVHPLLNMPVSALLARCPDSSDVHFFSEMGCR
jgi:2-amino-4-hydroxy-6-hydroxymethyldihydropteridine diphosphokinase